MEGEEMGWGAKKTPEECESEGGGRASHVQLKEVWGRAREFAFLMGDADAAGVFLKTEHDYISVYNLFTSKKIKQHSKITKT